VLEIGSFIKKQTNRFHFCLFHSIRNNVISHQRDSNSDWRSRRPDN